METQQTFTCPVPLCRDHIVEFEDEAQLKSHLLERHSRSVRKNTLEDLLAFSEAHPGEWYLSEWRQIDASAQLLELRERV